MQAKLIERLMTYAKIDTQSDFTSETTPSTAKQWDLIRHLEAELKAIGLEDVETDEYGYLFATLPSNVDHDVPTIGLLAHVDTATDFTGTNVNPQLVEHYAGGDIVLNEALNVILSPRDFPELDDYVGHTLMTTDGTTLLGADDKAGMAEIVTAVEYLLAHPEIPHGPVRIAFTPDEEIGRGPHKFDVARFNADFAYTMDGGPLGELQYESFNAAGATVTFHGTNVHPGSAKNKMVNSMKLAMAFQNRLPADEAPEHTSHHEGFFHLNGFSGDVETTVLQYIIRDHDRTKFEARKVFLEKLVAEWKQKYGEARIDLKMDDQYYNMAEKIEPVKHIVDTVADVMRELGIEPVIEPIRGGTDGSQLSYMGLPTPNIFTGGENYHGKFEYVSVNNMEKATHVIIQTLRTFAERARA
ncbi:peptidase T [Exiguobacterium sp. SH3S1]|uniref:peptidase T n=1 Tax=Exiguobacterium sp. SH3S1 TaxID=2510955 RepID=UPI00103892A5|nr:peptidase T [Exiguobacterium sp. SH3S1]TCI62189.1 peptidase T [Exiguobacterium sp. SH3S1]